jgi:Bacterial regulatory proteins, luxR family
MFMRLQHLTNESIVPPHACEREVAQGKANRAIADELVVGIVEAYISHIFTKLGFSSRAQIAACAVDKGLPQRPQEVEGRPPQDHHHFRRLFCNRL